MVGSLLDLQLFHSVDSTMAKRPSCMDWDLCQIIFRDRLHCHDHWGLGNRRLRRLPYFRDDVTHSRYCSYLDQYNNPLP